REFVGRGAHDFFGFIFGPLIGVNEPAGVSEFGLQNWPAPLPSHVTCAEKTEAIQPAAPGRQGQDVFCALDVYPAGQIEWRVESRAGGTVEDSSGFGEDFVGPVRWKTA